MFDYGILDLDNNRLWNNTIFLIKFLLDFPASIGLVNGVLHGFGDFVRIENHGAVGITGGPTAVQV